MRDKVLIIKDILKIIISVLIIATAIKSCSFASEYILTQDNMRTIVEQVTNATDRQTMYLNSFITQYNNNINSYDCCAITTQTYSNGNIHMAFFNSQYVTEITYNKNVNFMSIKSSEQIKTVSLTYQPGDRWTNPKINVTTITREPETNVQFGSGAQYRTNWLFISNSFLTFDGPWESSQLIGPFTPPIVWEVNNFSSTRVTIPKLNITATAITRKWAETELATIKDSRWLEEIEVMYMYYDNNYQDWITLNSETLYNYNINGSVLDNFITDTTTEDPYWKSYIYLNSNKFKNNMIFRVTFKPDEFNQEQNNLANLEDWFVVVNNKTIITSGELNESLTFSGDYYTQYQQDIEDQIKQNEEETNTQDIIDGINNITNTINTNNENNKTWLQQKMDEWFKIESGDIIEIVESTISDIKMGSGEIAVDLQILNYIRDGEAEDLIISWENANPNLTIKGEPIPMGDGNILQSMGYMIPSNQINFSKMERENETFHSVMVWERIIINLSILMIIANQFYLVILQLFGLATTEYGHNQEEKRNLQRAQEAQQAKIRNQLWNANQEKVRAYERLARQKGWKK